MEKYVADLKEIEQFVRFSLIEQRRAMRTNGQRLSAPEAPLEFIGECYRFASGSFLARIHNQIHASLPPIEQNALEDDLAILAHGLAGSEFYPKPELTRDYLKSLGKENYADF